MIKGIGLDIVEINRIKQLYERNPRFAERILTPSERNAFERLESKRKIEWLAGRFAAKEAFVKALGTGIGHACSFMDISVQNDDHGKPELIHSFGPTAFLSITHTKEYAAAQVILTD